LNSKDRGIEEHWPQRIRERDYYSSPNANKPIKKYTKEWRCKPEGTFSNSSVGGTSLQAKELKWSLDAHMTVVYKISGQLVDPHNLAENNKTISPKVNEEKGGSSLMLVEENDEGVLRSAKR
jgi:hypothetical protein